MFFFGKRRRSCPPRDSLEDAESLAIQRALGDEHSYSYDDDPAAADMVDNRLIVRSVRASDETRAPANAPQTSGTGA